jgi:hypothetical protein
MACKASVRQRPSNSLCYIHALCKRASLFIFTFGSRSPADERLNERVSNPNPSLKTAAASQPGGFLLPLYTLINFPRSP